MKYILNIVYSIIEKHDELIIENGEINEKNLSKYFKLMKEKILKMKYYNKKKETPNYISWEFDYDGHQHFYILYDKQNKYWYAIGGGRDFYPDTKYKNLKLECFDLVKSGRYWYDIWCSKYITNILDILFNITNQKFNKKSDEESNEESNNESWISDISIDVEPIQFIKKIKVQMEKLNLELESTDNSGQKELKDNFLTDLYNKLNEYDCAK